MAEKSGTKFKDLLLKVKVRLFSKDALTFLLFLVLSATFWFVHTLDKERERTLSLPVKFIGIPEDIQVTNELPDKITIVIRDEGLKLLQYDNKKMNPLTLDLTRVYFAKGEIIITPDQLKGRLSRYVLPTTAVLSIKPDSIVIHYQKRASKELPIKLSSKIQLTAQYMLSDSIRIEPATVRVFGPKHVIDTMKAVYTEPVKLENVSDTILLKTKLKPLKEVDFSFTDVSVAVFVEMFTEKKEQIPITVINSPAGVNVRIFPVNVEMIYNVGLSNFNKVKINDIQAVFDYNDVKDSQKRRYKLKVINNSPYISNLRFSPEEVEFLIEEK